MSNLLQHKTLSGVGHKKSDHFLSIISLESEHFPGIWYSESGHFPGMIPRKRLSEKLRLRVWYIPTWKVFTFRVTSPGTWSLSRVWYEKSENFLSILPGKVNQNLQMAAKISDIFWGHIRAYRAINNAWKTPSPKISSYDPFMNVLIRVFKITNILYWWPFLA